jgi:hypothetical protein
MKIATDYCIVDKHAFKVFAKTNHVADIVRMQDLEALDLDVGVNVNLYVGAHQWLFSRLRKDGINIGVQTEQFYDQQGKRLWGYRPTFFLYLLLNKFDYVIDYSEFNKSAYGFMSNSSRIFFGPYIFPRKRKKYIQPTNDQLIFVGDTSGRRHYLLGKLGQKFQLSCINNRFYDDIISELKECRGLLNIHNEDAVYTEWPRFLMAYVSGKVIFTEALGSPLKEGLHYLRPDGFMGASDDLKISIYNRVDEEIVARYQISKLLAEHKLGRQIGPLNTIFANVLLIAWSIRMLIVKLGNQLYAR